MTKLHIVSDKIKQFCKQNKILPQGCKIIVALSGGADSAFLLNYLKNENYEVEAAHCNFHLRGEESMRDEHFVTELCRQLDITLHKTDFNTESYAREKGISIEMAARELRYNWFEALRESRKMDVVAVAHHKDDNIEGVILNMVRGTGIKGMKGMMAQNGTIVRPLLSISRSDIMDVMEEMGWEHVDDHTNFENIYCRNKVRLDIIPMLKTINPSAAENITRTIGNMMETWKIYEDAMQKAMDECTHRKNHTLYINKEKLARNVSPTSVIHEILKPSGFNSIQERNLMECSTTGKLFYSPTHTALIDRNMIIVYPNTEHDEMNIPLSEFKAISVERKRKEDVTILPDATKAYLDVKKIKGELKVRHIRKGDKFQPFGMKGNKLMSDYLTDLKLSREEKEGQMVVCDNEKIVWVVGRRASEVCRVTSQTDEIIVLDSDDHNYKA